MLSIGLWDAERMLLFKLLTPIVAKGMLRGIESGAALLGDAAIGMDWDLINAAALSFAENYSYELVTNLTDVTKRIIESAISDGIREGWSLNDVLESLILNDETGAFSRYRAWSIATTETTRAYKDGNLQAWGWSGVVDEKRWNTARDKTVCEICEPLDGETRPLYSEDFEGYSGMVDGPPAHVNCRCWLRPVIKR